MLVFVTSGDCLLNYLGPAAGSISPAIYCRCNNTSHTRGQDAKEFFMNSLQGKVALVTGASRGAGRAIAAVLGEAGATVYVTGRTTRGGQANPEELPGTIEDTADEVTKRGGKGIPVRCDHTQENQIAA